MSGIMPPGLQNTNLSAAMKRVLRRRRLLAWGGLAKKKLAGGCRGQAFEWRSCRARYRAAARSGGLRRIT